MESKDDVRLERLDRLATLLDESIRIPLIGYRIGYDALIGLIPGAGDIAGLALSTYIVVESARFRIPKSTLLRMIANVAIEAVVGAVPLAGDLFDAIYKANRRNLNLLKKRLGEQESDAGSDRRYFAAVLSLPVIAALLILVALVWVLAALL